LVVELLASLFAPLPIPPAMAAPSAGEATPAMAASPAREGTPAILFPHLAVDAHPPPFPVASDQVNLVPPPPPSTVYGVIGSPLPPIFLHGSTARPALPSMFPCFSRILRPQILLHGGSPPPPRRTRAPRGRHVTRRVPVHNINTLQVHELAERRALRAAPRASKTDELAGPQPAITPRSCVSLVVAVSGARELKLAKELPSHAMAATELFHPEEGAGSVWNSRVLPIASSLFSCLLLEFPNPQQNIQSQAVPVGDN
ncbi:hypothetical protein EJB05_35753, partial [Eragrostis curvula]